MKKNYSTKIKEKRFKTRDLIRGICALNGKTP